MPASAKGKKKTEGRARAARLGLRATARQQELIYRAAEVTNKSVTEFILDSACAAAETALLDQQFFLVEDEQLHQFQKALNEPAKIVPGLKDLFKEDAPWE